MEFLDFIVGAARRHGCFELRLGARVTDLIVEGGAVRGVRWRDGEGDRELRAPLTVAAHGRASRVRQLAGFVPRRNAATMDVMWLVLPRGDDERAADMTGFRIGRGRLVVVLARAREWQLGYTVLKGSSRAVREAGLDALRSELGVLLPELADRMDAIRNWQDVHFLSVESSRIPTWHRDGLLAIGDAAHVMSPIGGVGINYAIQDAVAAANVLSGPLLAGNLTDAHLAAGAAPAGLAHAVHPDGAGARAAPARGAGPAGRAFPAAVAGAHRAGAAVGPRPAGVARRLGHPARARPRGAARADSDWVDAMAGRTPGESTKVPGKAAADRAKAKPVLLSGGNPQIAKADGDAPVQAYIVAMPGWKSDVGRRLDELIVRTVPEPRHGTAYVSSWIKALENNPKGIRGAAVDAQRISDWLMARRLLRRGRDLVYNRPAWLEPCSARLGKRPHREVGSGDGGHAALAMVRESNPTDMEKLLLDFLELGGIELSFQQASVLLLEPFDPPPQPFSLSSSSRFTRASSSGVDRGTSPAHGVSGAYPVYRHLSVHPGRQPPPPSAFTPLFEACRSHRRGGVERRRHGYRPWVGFLRILSPQSHRPYPVSCERSSNRACRSPAHGSRNQIRPNYGQHDARRNQDDPARAHHFDSADDGSPRSPDGSYHRSRCRARAVGRPRNVWPTAQRVQ